MRCTPLLLRDILRPIMCGFSYVWPCDYVIIRAQGAVGFWYVRGQNMYFL
jgi:hypothetical protein